MKEKPRSPLDHILNPGSITDLLWCGVLIGGLAYTNFVLFFARNGVGAAHADSLQPGLYAKATALTYLTIVLCQLLNILQRRSVNGLFTRYQLHNKALLVAMLTSMACVLTIIYNPLVAPYFGAGPLNATDWLFALAAAALFVGARELQRYANKHHSRELILSLYRERITAKF